MIEEFNLSDCLEDDDDIEKSILRKEKVKEFIKREDDFKPKAEHMSEEFKTGMRFAVNEIRKNRHKNAGKDLI